MFGFLFKIVLVAGIVAGVGIWFTKYRQGGGLNLNPGSVLDLVKNVDFGQVGGQISQGLDSLVTSKSASPVVLGIEITDTSLKTIADTLSGLPPDQLSQIKQYICQPATPSSSSSQ